MLSERKLRTKHQICHLSLISPNESSGLTQSSSKQLTTTWGRPNQARAPDHTSHLPSVQHYGNVTDCGGNSTPTGRSGLKRVAKPTKRLKNPRRKHGEIYYLTLPPMLTPKKCGV